MKRIISMMLTVAMLAAMCVFTWVSVSAESTPWDGTAATAFSGGGDGSKEKPYQIATAGELQLFASIVNGTDLDGTGFSANPSAHAILTADIPFYNGTMIGSGSNRYSGEFNGNGHSITVEFIASETKNENDNALFRAIDNGAYIHHLVTEGIIDGEGTVPGAGGIVGNASGGSRIYNCISNVAISNVPDCAGGIVGYTTRADIFGCGFTGSINSSGKIGAIAGYAGVYTDASNIRNCFATATYTNIPSDTEANSISRSGSVSNCYFLNALNSNSGEQKAAGQFESGEVAWLLNGQTTTGDICFYMLNGKITLDKTAYAPLLSNGVYEMVKLNYLTINYEVEAGYFVTIPEEVTLGTTATIEAEDVILDEGKRLEVALTATNGTGNAFTVSNGGNGLLTYTVTNGNNTVSVGEIVLTVNPTNGSTGSTTLDFNKPTDTARYSGSYTGTVTFTVSVVD